MPYGMPKEVGGDSPSNDKWMEGCVNRVQKQKGKDGKPYGKDKAIAICKATFMKSHGNKSAAEFVISQVIMHNLTHLEGTDDA